ncbi:hypothetical protein DLM75_14285 [Leptospira stimsonii]|uniref:Uncharacterized protein n=1 Tax=Leptospira stimsonii TaxID=2202203 RepID=A0A396Z5S2_9LEPT|nr:hypothetical protein DLM75_14285 [Leptospira stimsonii]
MNPVTKWKRRFRFVPLSIRFSVCISFRIRVKFQFANGFTTDFLILFFWKWLKILLSSLDKRAVLIKMSE